MTSKHPKLLPNLRVRLPGRLFSRYSSLHLLAVLVLIALMPLLVFQLLSDRRRTEEIQHEVVNLFLVGDLLTVLRSETLNPSTVPLVTQGTTESSMSLDPSPLGIVSAIALAEEGERLTDGGQDCQDLRTHSGIAFAMDCVAVLPLPARGERVDLSSRDRLIAQWAAPLLLNLHQQVALAESAPTNYPDILLAHLVIEIGDDRWFLVYPAARIQQEYDYRNRPWFKDPFIHENLEVSPLYRDYVTRNLIVTISRTERHEATLLNLGVDCAIAEERPPLGAHILNLLLLLLATTAYTYFYRRLRLEFLLYLLLSTATVVVTYLVLITNAGLHTAGLSTFSSSGALSTFLCFLPSDVLLLLAAWCLLRSPPPRWVILPLWAAQTLLCSISIYSGSALLSATLSCMSLTLFGLGLIFSRNRYRDRSFRVFHPRPSLVCWYAGLSYVFWGLAQYGVVLATQGWPHSWQQLADSTILANIQDIMVSEHSTFSLLFYAKAVAVVLTLVLLVAIEGARLRNGLLPDRSVPTLLVNGKGRILFTDGFPPGFENLTGNYFQDLILDQEEAAELQFALANSTRLTSLLCRLGKLFEGAPYRISLEPGEDKRSLITLHRVDNIPIVRALDRALCEDTRAFLAELRQEVLDAPNQSALESLQKLIDRRGSVIEDEANGVLRAMDESSHFYPPKISTNDAVPLFTSKTEAFAKRNPAYQFSSIQPIGTLPQRLRVSRAVLELVFALVLEAIEGSLHSRGKSSSLALATGVVPGREDWSIHPSSYLSFVIRLSPSSEIEKKVKQAASREMLGVSADGSSDDGALRNLLLAMYLLRTFGGSLAGSPSPSRGMYEIAIRVQFFTGQDRTFL